MATKNKCDGTMCDHIEDLCRVADPQNIYVCTRKAGHSGDHIACSGNTHNMKTWPQKDTQNKKPRKQVVEE